MIMRMTRREFEYAVKGRQLANVATLENASAQAIMIAAAVGSSFSSEKKSITTKDLYDSDNVRHIINKDETIFETEIKDMIESMGEDGLAKYREAKARMDEKSRTTGWNPRRYSDARNNN